MDDPRTKPAVAWRRTDFDKFVNQHPSGAGSNPPWFYQSGFEFAKTPLLILNH